MRYLRRFTTYVGCIALIFLSSCKSEQKSNSVELHEGEHLTSFSEEITSSIHEFQVKAGANYTVEINVKNTGTQPWFGRAQEAWIDASYRVLDSKGNILPIESKRTLLDRQMIAPGESEPLKLQVVAPPNPGSYTLWVSMVEEGVDWFYFRGAKPLVLQVRVD